MGNDNAIDKIVEFARAAEQHNFDHFLLSDHYWYAGAADLLESWAVLAYLAGVTSRIRLGTCVTPITFRPPLQFAKFVTTLDVASGGRIIVGVGAGWLEEEFRMFSRWHPNRQRFRQFKEALQILIDAWTKDKVIFHGRFYESENSVVEPKPLQRPHPPVWFGGWGRNMLKLAGRMGNGWVPTGPRSGEAVKSSEDYRKFVQDIKRGLLESGRSADPFVFGCRFGLLDNPRDHIDEIQAFSSEGLNCYQIGVNVKKRPVEVIRSFGESVIPSF